MQRKEPPLCVLIGKLLAHTRGPLPGPRKAPTSSRTSLSIFGDTIDPRREFAAARRGRPRNVKQPRELWELREPSRISARNIGKIHDFPRRSCARCNAVTARENQLLSRKENIPPSPVLPSVYLSVVPARVPVPADPSQFRDDVSALPCPIASEEKRERARVLGRLPARISAAICLAAGQPCDSVTSRNDQLGGSSPWNRLPGSNSCHRDRFSISFRCAKALRLRVTRYARSDLWLTSSIDNEMTVESVSSRSKRQASRFSSGNPWLLVTRCNLAWCKPIISCARSDVTNWCNKPSMILLASR